MEKIEINGYKSIRHLSLDLNPINLLIGANGSGKSNFLSFFEFLRNVYMQNLQRFVALHGGVDKYLYEGRKVTSELSCHLNFGANGYSFSLEASENGFIFGKEGLWYDKNPFMKNPQNISRFGNESELRFCTLPRASFIIDYLDSLEKYHFHDTGEDSPFTRMSNVQTDTYHLYSKGENLAAFLFGIKKKSPVRYKLIVKTIQSIAPYFGDFFIVPDENGNVKLQWQGKHSSMIYGVNDFSDGTKRFVALAVLFLQPQLPQTIVIDEPELGLHPAAIAKLASMVRAASKRGCQIIMATQSADLINLFEPRDIITVDQINGESVFERLDRIDLKNWVNDYSLDELWRRSIITKGQPNN